MGGLGFIQSYTIKGLYYCNPRLRPRAGVVRIWAPGSLPSDGARAAVLLTGAPVTALAWDGRADKILCAPRAPRHSNALRSVLRPCHTSDPNPSSPELCRVLLVWLRVASCGAPVAALAWVGCELRARVFIIC